MNNPLKTNNGQQFAEQQRKLPKIIGVADSTHYLVGMVDSNKNFVELDEEEQVLLFNSLAQAKQRLRQHQYPATQLEYQSAYDEMCGLECSGHYREVIKL